MRKNLRYHYYVEGQCERKLIDELKRQQLPIISGKIDVFNAVQETRKGQLLHRSWVHCLFALFCRIQNNRTLQSVCINKNHSLCGDPHRFTASRFERSVLEIVAAPQR